MSPDGTLYEPSEYTPIDTKVPWNTKQKIRERNNEILYTNINNQYTEMHTAGVPRTQSRIWSQAELAADNALESFLALIMAAPRCCTVVMNSVFNLRKTQKFMKTS